MQMEGKKGGKGTHNITASKKEVKCLRPAYWNSIAFAVVPRLLMEKTYFTYGDNLTQVYEHLKECIFPVANKVLGVDDRKRKQTEKFSENLENKITEKKKAYMVADKKTWIKTKKCSNEKLIKMEVRNKQNEH